MQDVQTYLVTIELTTTPEELRNAVDEPVTRNQQITGMITTALTPHAEVEVLAIEDLT
ncbi:hypothetical protein [Corynebacterium phocae]|uniref:hypothetical protein n=1 Tax=Corynebacterium phocae TaxID=161895 RepID=UPI0012ED8540|nr:hypothetical protein [Corynebacterium phocae]